MATSRQSRLFYNVEEALLYNADEAPDAHNSQGLTAALSQGAVYYIPKGIAPNLNLIKETAVELMLAMAPENRWVFVLEGDPPVGMQGLRMLQLPTFDPEVKVSTSASLSRADCSRPRGAGKTQHVDGHLPTIQFGPESFSVSLGPVSVKCQRSEVCRGAWRDVGLDFNIVKGDKVALQLPATSPADLPFHRPRRYIAVEAGAGFEDEILKTSGIEEESRKMFLEVSKTKADQVIDGQTVRVSAWLEPLEDVKVHSLRMPESTAPHGFSFLQAPPLPPPLPMAVPGYLPQPQHQAHPHLPGYHVVVHRVSQLETTAADMANRFSRQATINDDLTQRVEDVEVGVELLAEGTQNKFSAVYAVLPETLELDPFMQGIQNMISPQSNENYHEIFNSDRQMMDEDPLLQLPLFPEQEQPQPELLPAPAPGGVILDRNYLKHALLGILSPTEPKDRLNLTKELMKLENVALNELSALSRLVNIALYELQGERRVRQHVMPGLQRPLWIKVQT